MKNEDSLADGFGCEGRGKRGELEADVRFKRFKKTKRLKYCKCQ